uniref:Uncharacterized protein n=1 Tax=Oryza rufipogon TaxID=4529 RepID=A0A0E0QK72_ORYRU
MRPCPTLELAGGRVLHAGARRRRPRPPRRSSSSAPPELVVGIADVSSSTLAAPTVARALVSQGGGEGAIPLGQYPNGIPNLAAPAGESANAKDHGVYQL